MSLEDITGNGKDIFSGNRSRGGVSDIIAQQREEEERKKQEESKSNSSITQEEEKPKEKTGLDLTKDLNFYREAMNKVDKRIEQQKQEAAERSYQQEQEIKDKMYSGYGVTREAELGHFRELDEKTTASANISDNGKLAYEKLSKKNYQKDELESLIDTYIKEAKELDKAFGPLAEQIKDDQKAIDILCKKLSEDNSIDKNTKQYLDNLLNEKRINSAYNLIERLFNEVNDNTTDQDKFWLPDMGDFYLGNVDTTLLEKIDKEIRDKKDGYRAAHYTSLAPQELLGYDEKKKMYFLKFSVNLTDKDLEDGLFDGNHLRLSLADAESSEDDETGALEKLESTVDEINEKHSFNNLFPEDSNDDINIDIVGIQCPKVPKWCSEYNSKLNNVTFEKFPKSEISADNGFVFIQEDYDNMGSDDTMLFVRVMNTWRQAVIMDKDYDVTANTIEGEDRKVFGLKENTPYKVTRVVDGDTFDIQGPNGTERIRIAGVNTPESKASAEYQEQSGKTNTEEGKTASEWLSKYLEGKSVTLKFEPDSKNQKDKYNRALAYIYVDGEFLNKKIIEMGYSRHTVYSNNTLFLDELSAAEEEAKAANRGFWAVYGDTEW